MTRLKSQVSAWAWGGNEPVGEVYGYPLNLLDPYFKASVEREPNITLMKAGRPAFNEHACAQLDPLPSLGATATDLDAYTRASVLLKGEQNSVLPCVGCKQYAAPYAPQPFSFLSLPLFLPSSNTHTCGIVPGEGVPPIQRTTNPHLEASKMPNQTPPEEPGGAGLRPVHTVEIVGTEAIKCMVFDVYEPGKASLHANTALAPTKGTASIKPASWAMEATTTRPEALEPRAESVEWSKLQLLPPMPPLPQEGPGKPRSPLQEAPSMGMCRRRLEAPPPPLREGLSTSKHRLKRAPQKPPPLLPQQGSGEPGLPPRAAPRVGTHWHNQLW